jgi:ParB family chromosome partitioning protein
MQNAAKTIEIGLANLVPYPNNPFKLYRGNRLEALVNSVRENGVLSPIIVRPQGERFGILSGHNRVEAAKKVELATIPAIVKGLSDDDERVIVTVTNLHQRSFSDLSHSERAATLSEHYNAIKNQGKRTDILTPISALLGDGGTCATMYHKLKARDILSKSYGVSGTLVAQYVRLSRLALPLRERLDNDEFSFRAAVELSALSLGTQERLEETLTREKRSLYT